MGTRNILFISNFKCTRDDITMKQRLEINANCETKVKSTPTIRKQRDSIVLVCEQLSFA